MYGNCLWSMEWSRREDREWSPLAGLSQGAWYTYDSETQTHWNPQPSPCFEGCVTNRPRLFALFAYISVNIWTILCCILAFVWTPLSFFLTYIFLILEVRKIGWAEEVPARHCRRLKGGIKVPGWQSPAWKINEKEGAEGSFCYVGSGADFLFQDMLEEMSVWDGENRPTVEILLALDIR